MDIDFVICNIKMGRNSQTMAPGEIPALAFAGDLDVYMIHGEFLDPASLVR
jgi:hypothetical protein